jgi:hypothetical protein
MRVLRLFRSRKEEPPDTYDIDLQEIAASGRMSREAARAAISVLGNEQKLLQRRLKVLSLQLKRMTSVRVRDVGRSGPMMGSLQMSHDMRSMQDAGQNSGVAMQEAETIARLKEVEDLMDDLKKGD